MEEEAGCSLEHTRQQSKAFCFLKAHHEKQFLLNKEKVRTGITDLCRDSCPEVAEIVCKAFEKDFRAKRGLDWSFLENKTQNETENIDLHWHEKPINPPPISASIWNSLQSLCGQNLFPEALGDSFKVIVGERGILDDETSSEFNIFIWKAKGVCAGMTVPIPVQEIQQLIAALEEARFKAAYLLTIATYFRRIKNMKNQDLDHDSTHNIDECVRAKLHLMRSIDHIEGAYPHLDAKDFTDELVMEESKNKELRQTLLKLKRDENEVSVRLWIKLFPCIYFKHAHTQNNY